MPDDDPNLLFKVVATVVVVVMMVPGLIIEPGPVSEIAGIGALSAIWGLDLGGGGGE
ncbi:hypothetical protein SAMN04488063_0118 [Halopelagius inordinatus]|uniref:Uncharacterized protein n=1 Tax=Halopelagius inordinatus TaxID=553467 RepID=A0A1I2X328_9EURY|nr:hypothetical protein [Halopelagius inordinatus]SFH07928.1 hypothetical protein SAMN04488063_0118 [Halopelagius inordinatus]